MFLEFLSHLVSFDFFWVVEFTLANLHWLFALFIPVYFFYDGKKTIAPFLIIVFMLWSFLDFSAISGWVFAVPGFLALYYISRVVLMIFANDMDSLKDKLPAIFVVHFLIIFAIFNLFLK